MESWARSRGCGWLGAGPGVGVRGRDGALGWGALQQKGAWQGWGRCSGFWVQLCGAGGPRALVCPPLAQKQERGLS